MSRPDAGERLLLRDDKAIEARAYEVPGAAGPESRVLLRHPGAVVLLPVLADGRVVFIDNARYTVGETLLELAAGTLHPGEDPAACAARELREETGYEAARLEPLGRFYAAPGYSDERLFAYLATDLSWRGQDLDASEEIAVRPLSEAEWRAALVDGTIEDAKTLATLALYTLRG